MGVPVLSAVSVWVFELWVVSRASGRLSCVEARGATGLVMAWEGVTVSVGLRHAEQSH